MEPYSCFDTFDPPRPHISDRLKIKFWRVVLRNSNEWKINKFIEENDFLSCFFGGYPSSADDITLCIRKEDSKKHLILRPILTKSPSTTDSVANPTSSVENQPKSIGKVHHFKRKTNRFIIFLNFLLSFIFHIWINFSVNNSLWLIFTQNKTAKKWWKLKKLKLILNN